MMVKFRFFKCNNFQFAKKGKKVLLIDADAQGSLTASLGFQEPDKLDVSLATGACWACVEKVRWNDR